VHPATGLHTKVGFLVPIVSLGEIRVALPGKEVDVQTVKSISGLGGSFWFWQFQQRILHV
jgi:hypothetical protein